MPLKVRQPFVAPYGAGGGLF